MINLSVNVNKIATLRNARGGDCPNVIEAVHTCVRAGAQGITVHPRADKRHITANDVWEIAEILTVEYNIEGDPRPDLLNMVMDVRPNTSHNVWDLSKDGEQLKPVIQRLKGVGIRVSLFSGTNLHQIELAKEVGADRIELYTAPYASARSEQEIEAEFDLLVRSAQKAAGLGLGINAGHDLNLDNLPRMQKLPGLLEVSIGHHLISHALYVGIEQAVADYRAALGQFVE